MITFEQVRDVVSDSLGVPQEDVKPASSFVSLGADSLSVVQLILDLEDAFDIEIPNDDAKHIFTVKDALEYAKKVAA